MPYCIYILPGKLNAKTCTGVFDEQVFLDKFYLLVCTAKVWQLFLDKEPISTRKILCVYGRQGKLGQVIAQYVTARSAPIAFNSPYFEVWYFDIFQLFLIVLEATLNNNYQEIIYRL